MTKKDDTYPGSSRTTLARAEVDDAPPAPALFALARFHYAPDAAFGPAAGPGPVLFRVEEGELHFRAEEDVPLTRRGDAPGSAEVQEADAEFVIGVGDQLLVPGEVVHEARNEGDDDAVILGAAIFPDQPPREFPEGVTFEPLVIGRAGTLPGGPLAVEVETVVLSPGVDLPDRIHDGPGIEYVVEGTVEVGVRGEGHVTRAGADPGSPPEAVPDDGTVTLEEGDGLVVQGGAVSWAHNPSDDEPAKLIDVTLAGPRIVRPDDGKGDGGDVAARKDLLRSFVREVMDAGNPGAVPKFLAPNFINHDLPPGGEFGLKKTGVEGVQGFLGGLIFPAFSDFRTEFRQIVGERDLVAGHWTQTFEHTGEYLGTPATGNTVTIGGISMVRIRNGAMQEQWEVREIASWFRQIGLLPEAGELEDPGRPELPPRKVVKAYYYDAWAGRRANVVYDLFAEDYVNHTPEAGQREGREGARQLITAWNAAFPDHHISVDHLFREGDRVAVRWTSRGTHRGRIFGARATGKRVTVPGIDIFRVEDGRIVERWGYVAKLSLLTQVGAVRLPGPPGGGGGGGSPYGGPGEPGDGGGGGAGGSGDAGGG